MTCELTVGGIGPDLPRQFPRFSRKIHFSDDLPGDKLYQSQWQKSPYRRFLRPFALT